MWCSPSLQMPRLTAGWLLSTSTLLISPSATPRMMSLGTSYSKKMMYSAAIASESLALEGQNCRVDVHVDSQVTIHAWNGQGTRSR